MINAVTANEIEKAHACRLDDLPKLLDAYEKPAPNQEIVEDLWPAMANDSLSTVKEMLAALRDHFKKEK